MPPWTPARSSPGTRMGMAFQAPSASSTASYSARSASNWMSRPSFTLLTISTPASAMISISRSSTALGRRYSGMP